MLLFKPIILKHYFFNAGRTFDVSKITKNPFYTLNIDPITKPQKSIVKNISIRHMKKKINNTFLSNIAEKASKLYTHPLMRQTLKKPK